MQIISIYHRGRLVGVTPAGQLQIQKAQGCHVTLDMDEVRRPISRGILADAVERLRQHAIRRAAEQYMLSTVLNATPMMADVVCGASPRPIPPDANYETPERRGYWAWALDSHAGRAALEYLGIPATELHASPRHEPGRDERANDWLLRQLSPEEWPVIVYVERCAMTPAGEYIRSQEHYIAINADGTRAMLLPLPVWTQEVSDEGARIADGE